MEPLFEPLSRSEPPTLEPEVEVSELVLVLDRPELEQWEPLELCPLAWPVASPMQQARSRRSPPSTPSPSAASPWRWLVLARALACLKAEDEMQLLYKQRQLPVELCVLKGESLENTAAVA